jgi:hypothetical protein
MGKMRNTLKFGGGGAEGKTTWKTQMQEGE